MVATEIKTDGITIRIHDEFCSDKSDTERMWNLNRIVSESYKRRCMPGITSINEDGTAASE